jgi:hypothetical protein
MADFNPLNELPDPKSFQGSNMGGTFMLPGFFQAAQQREQAAAPFIQMAQEAERMKIDKDRQMNPLLIQEKQGTVAKTGLENDRYGKLTPFAVSEADLKNKGLGLANVKAGYENDIAGAELPGKIQDIKDKPLNEARARFAAMAKELQEKPGVTKVSNYMEAARAIHDQITDDNHRRQFYEEFLHKPTKGMQSLQARHAGIYNTAGAEQAKDVAKIGADASIRGHELSAGAAVQAARISAASHEKIEKEKIAHPKKYLEEAAAALGRVRKAYAEGKDPDPVDYMKAEDYVDTQFATVAKGDIGLSTRSMHDPEAYKQAIEANRKAKLGVKARPGPTQDAAIQQRVIESGIQYEPDKYEYRIGPNGNVQRAPKGS